MAKQIKYVSEMFADTLLQLFRCLLKIHSYYVDIMPLCFTQRAQHTNTKLFEVRSPTIQAKERHEYD